MNKATIEGQLKTKGHTEQVTDTFKKRLFTIEVGGKYPQVVQCQFSQDNCGKLDEYNEGDTINVEANIRGREYNGKYYNTIEAWKITRVAVAPTITPTPTPPTLPPMVDKRTMPKVETIDNDLPF